METLLDLVDAVFVINLPERTDRRRRMDAVLSSIGMSFDQPNVHLFPAVKVSDPAGFPSAGVHGCFLSHKTVFEKARDAGYQRVLILEDDVEFAQKSLDLMATLADQLNGSTPNGFFYFGYEDPNAPANYATKHSDTLHLEAKPGRVVCAHAYVVSSDILDPLIQHLDDCLSGTPGDTELGPMDVDGAFNAFRRRYPEITATVVEPQLAWQRVTHSDLHARSWHQLPGVRWLLGPLRWFKNCVNSARR